VFHIFNRAEELETALMEMVKEDNRLQLTARVYARFEKFIFLFYIISLLLFAFLRIWTRPNSTPKASSRGEDCSCLITTILAIFLVEVGSQHTPFDIQDEKSRV
jgi:hypothetical protein